MELSDRNRGEGLHTMGKRQFPEGKNDKNREWMLAGQEAINVHLPIFAFVG